MNRRSFFTRIAGALVAAALAPIVKWHTESPITTLGPLHLTYRGMPVVSDTNCRDNHIYFLAADVLTRKGVEPLF